MVKALFLLGSTLFMAAHLCAHQQDEVDLSLQTRRVMMTDSALLTALQSESQGKNISRLSFSGQASVTDDFLKQMLNDVPLPRLNRLNLDDTSVTNAGVRYLLNSCNTAVQSTAPLGNTATFVVNVSAGGTAVEVSTFHRQTVNCQLLVPVSSGTQHLPIGAFVGEGPLSFKNIVGQKKVAVTK